MKWTPQTAELAKSLFKGGKSATQVAMRLRQEGLIVSRNAVIGKLTRMGIKRGNAARPKFTRAKSERHNRRAYVDPRRPARKLPKTNEKRGKVSVQLSDLNSHHCRWPVSGTGAETWFCGEPRVTSPGQPYCAAHRAKGRQPT